MKRIFASIAVVLAAVALLGMNMSSIQSTPFKGKGGRFLGHGASGDWVEKNANSKCQCRLSSTADLPEVLGVMD